MTLETQTELTQKELEESVIENSGFFSRVLRNAISGQKRLINTHLNVILEGNPVLETPEYKLAMHYLGQLPELYRQAWLNLADLPAHLNLSQEEQSHYSSNL